MKPLFVLITVFAISLVANKVFMKTFEMALAARVGMSAMLLFSALGHFMFTKGMSLMIPEFIPLKTEIVYLTGMMEIGFAAGLLIPNYQITTAWLLIAFLIIVLPANIYAGIKQVDYQNATFTGNGLSYLWFRIPLQMLFIGWTYLSAIKIKG